MAVAVHGQQHAEDAAFARLALHCYLTAVFVDDLGDDRQAQADAFRLGGEERIEDVFMCFGLDARAAVDHGDFRGASAGARLHRDGAARRAWPARR